MIHDVILWNGPSLKHNIHFSRGILDWTDHIDLPRQDRATRRWLACCLISDHFQIAPPPKSATHIILNWPCIPNLPHDETAVSHCLLLISLWEPMRGSHWEGGGGGGDLSRAAASQTWNHANHLELVWKCLVRRSFYSAPSLNLPSSLACLFTLCIMPSSPHPLWIIFTLLQRNGCGGRGVWGVAG